MPCSTSFLIRRLPKTTNLFATLLGLLLHSVAAAGSAGGAATVSSSIPEQGWAVSCSAGCRREDLHPVLADVGLADRQYFHRSATTHPGAVQQAGQQQQQAGSSRCE
eukprot:COSAG05_NODE_5175_length_1244_cov_10.993299_2_plen_107_part_00